MFTSSDRWNNDPQKDFSHISRQSRRRERFKAELAAVKEKHGHGAFSWAEGITRQTARRIARVRAHA